MGAVLLALHLTPGRRLSATVSQWLGVKLKDPAKKDGVMATISDLLKANPWSFSLQDLAESLGCLQDDYAKVFLNTEWIMVHIVNRLAWSLDAKVKDMAHRQEVAMVRKVRSEGCSHNVGEQVDLLWYSATLSMGKFEWEDGDPGTVTVDELQERIDSSLRGKILGRRTCNSCSAQTVQYSRWCIVGNEPDFLILRMGGEVDFEARDMKLIFGRSSYSVKTVMHWDSKELRSSVSTEKKDGWYWHGVDEGQVEEQKYTNSQLDDFLNFDRVAALFLVRTGSSEECAVGQEEQNIENMSTSFNQMDISEAPPLFEPEGQQIPESPKVFFATPSKQSGRRQAGGPSPAAASTPVRNPREQKKPRLDDTFVSPIRPTNRKLFADDVERESQPTSPRKSNILFGGQSFGKIRQGDFLAEDEAEIDRLQRIAEMANDMEKTAAIIASRINMSLCRGVSSAARGQCLFECGSDQILHRVLWLAEEEGEENPLMFQELIDDIGMENLSAQSIREGTVDLLSNNEMAFERFPIETPGDEILPEEVRRERYAEEMEQLRRGGEYAMGAGDLMADGMSAFLGLYIIMLRSNTPDDHPIQLHIPQTMGGTLRHDMPLLVIYSENRSHYEEARPADMDSDQKLLFVKEIFLENHHWPYKYNKKDAKNMSGTQSLATQSQGLKDRLPSKLNHGRSICSCEFEGHYANHLRRSPECVEDLRRQQELQFMERERPEAFIAKVALIQKTCPAPQCPGGDHKRKPLPEKCFEWYLMNGKELMGFQGLTSHTTNAAIKTKINNFLKNTRQRHPQLTQGNSQQQSERTQMSMASQEENFGDRLTQLTNRDNPQQILCINRCVYDGTLAVHLRDNHQCCSDYIKQHLNNRLRLYKDKQRLAVFDLSILLLFCSNPACDPANRVGEHSLKALCTHIQGPCLNFYQTEGTFLLKWPENLDPDSIYAKLNNRRKHLLKFTRDTEESRMDLYKEEFNNNLTLHCQTCFIQGPIPGIQDHNIEWVGNTQLHMCTACLSGDESHIEMVAHVGAKLEDFSKAKPADNTAMVAVEVEHPQTHVKRVVFVPSHLQGDLVTLQSNLPYTATVAVPNRPESLDEIEEKFFDNALNDKDSLREVTQFASVRPMVGPPTEELSVFWRKKQSDIKAERLSIFKSFSGTGKGKIEKRKPNIASISKRNTSYNQTLQLCLGETCSWSEGAREKRCKESEARSSVNGIVKTWVNLTLVNFVATDEANTTLKLAPVILTKVYNKLRALVKHIIGPSYSNYDLELRFYETEWRINLLGFLYSQQYDEINAKVAKGDKNMQEILLDIYRHRDLRPTVSLDYAQLTKDYGIGEERAKHVVTLARKHQSRGDLEPLSLLDLNTPEEVNLHPDELRLRTRAAHIGESFGEDESTYEAIETICETLMSEGFDRVALDYGNLDWLRDRILSRHEYSSDNIIQYHALLQRTGGEKGWTFERSTGESRIEPYILILLEANDQEMSAEVCFHGEQIETGHFEQDGGLTGFLPSSFGKWKEVSVLEFLNGCIPGSKVPLLKGPTNQAIVQIIAERNVKLTWRAIPDGDQGEAGDGGGGGDRRQEDFDQDEDVFLSKQGRPYMRTTGDIRTLYEMRPESLESMTLAQFATQYRVLKPEADRILTYENTVAEIEPATKKGPDSSDSIAGSPNIAAPLSMRLRNEKIMVKRSRGENAVPHLLHSGAVNKYANRLLFSPWRELESLNVTREDIETDREQEARLQIFPMSVFQICQEENDRESEDDSE